MGKFMTCLECLSVNVEKETTETARSGVPLVRRDCEDCDNSEAVIRGPGAESDFYDRFEVLADTEVVARRESAE